jgi:hypothetical protein
MLRGREPVLDDRGELVGRHSGVRREQDLDDAFLAGGREAFHVAGENGLVRLLVLPLRMLRRERLDAVEREQELEVHRLLAPQRAVVVEDGDALLRLDELGRALLRHLGDELGDRFLRRAVGPRGQRIVDRARGKECEDAD